MADVVETPACVELSGGRLTWQVGGEWLEPDRETLPIGLTHLPIEGCLQDFVCLADASPEEVLAFARKRGVLGVDPSVGTEGSGGRRGVVFNYQEDTCIYNRLARIAHNILGVMQSLKNGVSVRKTDVAECLPDRLWQSLVGHMNVSELSSELYGSHDAYYLLIHAIHHWWAVASLRMELPYPDKEETAIGKTPKFVLNFGSWDDGTAWDDRKLQNVDYAEEEEDMPKEDMPKEVAIYERISPGNGYWRYRASLLPGAHQRPSALFNVLTFQIMQAVTFPEGTYWCSQCRKPYQHDPTRWPLGKNKPRRDRQTSFCGPDCEDEWKTAYSRNWKREDAKRKRAAIDDKSHPNSIPSN